MKEHDEEKRKKRNIRRRLRNRLTGNNCKRKLLDKEEKTEGKRNLGEEGELQRNYGGKMNAQR